MNLLHKTGNNITNPANNITNLMKQHHKKRYVKNVGVMLFPFCLSEISHIETGIAPIRARLQTRVRVV